MSKVSKTESLASKLKFDDRLGRGVEIYRCVQRDHQWTDGPGMDIVQYNVILTCIVLASLYMITNGVLKDICIITESCLATLVDPSLWRRCKDFVRTGKRRFNDSKDFVMKV